eukprot:TRINITY_DN8366_c0_g1_i1.p1 TRINITY_DN8366_c0_g1~~TRINITY_DN8366_c0_g1_i1.p1  ORF type:complete len:108 (-),score=2.30 TRINITY_DN8366_c0_g1_i1:894-1217(-)
MKINKCSSEISQVNQERYHSPAPINSETTTNIGLDVAKKLNSSMLVSKLHKILHNQVLSLNATSFLSKDSSQCPDIPSPHPLQPSYFRASNEPVRYGVPVVVRLDLE